jgi:hypothetical protein
MNEADRAKELSRYLLAAIATQMEANPQVHEKSGMPVLAIWKLKTIHMGNDPGTLVTPDDHDLDYDQLRDDMVACRSIYEGLIENMEDITKGGPSTMLCEVARRAFPNDGGKADVLIWDTNAFEGFEQMTDAYHLIARAEQSEWVEPKTEGITAVFDCSEVIALSCKQKEMRLRGWELDRELCIASLITPDLPIPHSEETDAAFRTTVLCVLQAAGTRVLNFLFD